MHFVNALDHKPKRYGLKTEFFGSKKERNSVNDVQTLTGSVKLHDKQSQMGISSQETSRQTDMRERYLVCKIIKNCMPVMHRNSVSPWKRSRG